MKRKIVLLSAVFLCIIEPLVAIPLRYTDVFELETVDQTLLVRLTFNETIEASIQPRFVYEDELIFIIGPLKPGKGFIFIPYEQYGELIKTMFHLTYRSDSFHALTAFERFIMITKSFEVLDMQGTVLVKRDDLRPEHFSSEEKESSTDITILISRFLPKQTEERQ